MERARGSAIEHFHYGSVHATIWENPTEGGGAYYSATFQKRYRQGDEWKSTQSYSFDDLLNLSKANLDAHTYIARLHAQARENTRTERPQERRGPVTIGQAILSACSKPEPTQRAGVERAAAQFRRNLPPAR